MTVQIAIPEGLEPLAVWDCNDGGSMWHDGHWRERQRWAVAHGLGDVADGAFYVLDGVPAVVVRRIEADMSKPPVGKPELVVLSELPPAHLLGVRG